MDLKFTGEEEAFRAEVRAFFAAELPADIRENMTLGRRLRKEDLVRWQKILYRHGWGAGMWPQALRRRRLERRAAAYLRRGVRRRRRAGAECRSRCAWWRRC